MLGRLEYIILDAMGVIYTAGEDVGELLIPFLRSKGCLLSDDEIKNLYLECSLGQITSRVFWERSGIQYYEGLDEEYIQGHQLMSGLKEFLDTVQEVGLKVACLSNDVSEWSLLQRKRFRLDEYINHWFISGDLNLRKPNEEIYKIMINKLDVQPSACLFLDDRVPNLLTASQLGIRTMMFGGQISMLSNDDLLKYHVAPTFEEAMKCIRLMK